MIDKRICVLSVFALFALTLLIMFSCTDDDDDDSSTGYQESYLANAIRIEALMAHLQTFQDIALTHTGHRAAGSQAYNDCVSYIESQLPVSEYVVQEQVFEVVYFEETEPPVLSQITPEQITYIWMQDYATLTYSGSGDVESEIVFIDPQIPPDPDNSSSTDGCDPEDYAGIDVNAKIAVIQRGGCNFEEKVRYATSAGALAVLIFNEGQQGRTEVFSGSLGESSAITIPVLAASYQVGLDLYNLVQQGHKVTMKIHVVAISGSVPTANITAETLAGDSNQVIMLGAHLDSVSTGPGINDNGSGSAALLELANQMYRLDYRPVNKIRIAWWAAEEQGLLGSLYYLEYLHEQDPQTLDTIAMYLNFDMIGSPNYIRGVLDSDQSDLYSGFDRIPHGADDVEQAFLDYFEFNGLPTVPASLGGSDHVGFILSGIPSGGLFTGASGRKSTVQQAVFGGMAGDPFDPCYHAPCDKTDNINQEIYLQNAKALAHVTQYFSASATGMISSLRRDTSAFLYHPPVNISDPLTALLHQDRYFRVRQ